MSPRPAPDLAARRDLVVGHARRIAEAQGWDAVTIRRLATELGVTQPVVYTAFGGRQEIVDAVALRGFAELAAALGAGDPTAAYLDFARAHPATYEAMFLMPTGLPFAAPDAPAPLHDAFTALGRALGSPDDVRTEVAWSLLHGVASLDRAGRLSDGARDERRAEVRRLLGAPRVVHASHTHLFPGARLTGLGTGPLRLVLSDDAEAGGELLDDVLAVDAYRTAAGRDIPARRWRVADGLVTARLP